MRRIALNFDEEVRRHLRDTGEQVTLTPGLVETVRLKALKRVRRRRQVLTGMTSIAAIALLTAVAANLLGGTDPAGTMQPASISESGDKADDETLESSNVELKTSVTATYRLFLLRNLQPRKPMKPRRNPLQMRAGELLRRQ